MTVGLFFPLPDDLAKEFPSLGEMDDSPPHVTFLFVGEGPEPEDVPRFLDVVRAEVQNWPWQMTGELVGLDYFHNPDHTVAYDRVSFFNDMASLRLSMLRALESNGFKVEDSYPLAYRPHATLAYLAPGDTYTGDVPRGSWTFNTVEVWGLGEDPVEIPVGNVAQRVAMAVRVAARYKSKKKIKTQDGRETTVYEYSDRQVANRHREKAERVEHLRKHMSDLRARVKKDLKSEDPQTRMTALAVSLMDHTCERVGNNESADEGHYGVTGWLVDHVTIRDGKATIEYVGKSGVDHKKTVEDGPTVTALKKLIGDREGSEPVFDTEDARVTSECVNDYLAEFDITAKDIRGFRANDEMCKALREERSKGPKDLPRGRKERDKILKAEFKRALETVAEVVGHEAATLRSQYLVPGLEDEFVKDGTVLKSLKVGSADYIPDFFRRHPSLGKYRNTPFRMVEKPSGGSYPEARTMPRWIEVYPKFWDLPDGRARDFVLAHEIGHWVLAEFGMSNLVSIAQSIGVDVWDRPSLPFGAINFDEAFADSFAEFHMDRAGFARRYPQWDRIVAAVTSGSRVGTKTDSEREEESVERLVKPAPKKKPPRRDLRRNRIDVEDSDTDRHDDDLSLNYKDAAVRVAMAVRIARRVMARMSLKTPVF